MEPPDRRDDDFDQVPPPPPRRRRRPADDYDDDEGYDEPRRRHLEEDTWIDQQFNQTSIVILVLFSLLCGIIAVIFGILGVAICRDPRARQKSIIVLVISLVYIAVATAVVILRATGAFR
jgi:hypothetical protein